MNKLGKGSADASQRVAPGANVTGHAADAQTLYVITLTSAATPMPLQGPSAPELASLALFRSKKCEDGRDRYRLHLGYFTSAELAEEVLPLVRDSFPAAFVAASPQTNMGSLDDTAITRFSIIQPIGASPPEPVMPVAPPPKPQAVPPAQPRATASRPVVAAAPRKLPSQTQVPRTMPQRSLPPKTAQPRPASQSTSPARPAPSRTLAIRQPATEPSAGKEPSQEKVTQHYAVQLLWSEQAIDPGAIPSLEIFLGYLLYAVETQRGGRRMYGVRLGFYVDALSASLVARYVRPRFANAAVVPVSDREHERASTAAIGLASPATRRTSVVRASWPASAIPVDFAPARAGGAAATP
jgi:hypothetical protein